MEPIKLHYSEQLIRQVMRLFWRRKIGLKLPLVTVLLALMLAYLLYSGYRDWLVGASGATLIIAMATMIAVYVVHLNRSLDRFRRMKQPTATIELMDEFFKISTEKSLVEIEWSQISTVWCFENAWLVFLSPNDFLTLPLAEMSEQDKLFIANKVKEQGAKIG